eukprot:scaffold336134_cov32-Prasinocladus_malaysianus.AAC.2
MLQGSGGINAHGQVRFCPALHTLEGLSLDEVVSSVCQGVEAAKADSPTRISGGIIVCALRSLPDTHSMEMAQLAHRLSRGM